MIRWLILAAVLMACPLLLAQETKDDQKASATQPSKALYPRVKLETTLGDIVLELNGEKAPISSKNFIEYIDAGFYDGTVFHRVISDFMIQGGGFTETMDHKTKGLHPPIKNEWKNGLKNKRGTIAMARSAAPDSATSQFFINVTDNTAGMKYDLDTPRGPAAYAVFGKVVEGLDVVDKIRNTKVIAHPKYRSQGRAVVPDPAVVIKSARVVGEFDRKALATRVEANEMAAKETEVKAAAEQRQKLEAFVQKTEKETGKKVEKTASGLMYTILKEGTGPQPQPTDLVEVHYTGTFLDGSKFDSSVDRGQPFRFSLRGGVIQGWLEGVRLMKVGEKRKLIIPGDLAYGPNGRGKIPPNATLVFDIELLSIVESPKPGQ